MIRFGGGFGGGSNHNIPIPKDVGSGVVSNGLNIYALINMGLHFLTEIAILLLILYIVRRITKHPIPFCQRTDKALDLLNERLARGDIDPEDYVTRKRALGYKTE